jgi:hypothetical protein
LDEKKRSQYPPKELSLMLIEFRESVRCQHDDKNIPENSYPREEEQSQNYPYESDKISYRSPVPYISLEGNAQSPKTKEEKK